MRGTRSGVFAIGSPPFRCSLAPLSPIGKKGVVCPAFFKNFSKNFFEPVEKLQFTLTASATRDTEDISDITIRLSL